MAYEYEFTIWGEPICRAEGIARGGKHLYDKRKKEKFYIKECLALAHKEDLLTGPLKLEAHFFTTKAITSKPDLSNYFKLYEDCLTGTVIEDDRFIVRYGESGKYQDKNFPRTILKLTQLIQ